MEKMFSGAKTKSEAVEFALISLAVRFPEMSLRDLFPVSSWRERINANPVGSVQSSVFWYLRSKSANSFAGFAKRAGHF